MSISPAHDTLESLDRTRLPKHIAIIMDGNRRWAKQRGLPAIEGHRRGMLALREVTRAASDIGIEVVTVYGFSTENWQRDAGEIALLFDLCVYFAKHELKELQRNNVRVRIIGNWEALPTASREGLRDLQKKTEANTGVILNLAVNYSSRSEMTRAVRTLAREAADGKRTIESIDEDAIAAQLYTAGVPDPDLLIRPGGEHRLSNFMLYQAAYTELVMSDIFWPDFSREQLIDAVAEFQRRSRRFGGS